MDAVAPGLGAEIDDRIPDAGRLGVEDFVGLGDADRHRIDEDIAVIARYGSRSSRRRSARRNCCRSCRCRRRRRRRDGASCGCSGAPKRNRLRQATGRAPMVNTSRKMPPTPVAAPWKRLDIGGVVVALHLEDAGEPVADVDDAGILARPLDDPGRLGRQFAQMQTRGFVGTMLVPHGRENAELGEARRPADEARMRYILPASGHARRRVRA